MKKLIYLLSITIALTVITSANAKADDRSHDDHEGDSCGTPSTQLPINGGVEFLMVAGVVIGIVTVQKYKTVKTTAVQE
ncbi:MAG: hypothetical protein ACTHNW_06165 [Mucilaginibacter sp.]